ncbi:hypothetical protein ACH4M0_01445 [Streptomyces albidoflavus]
MPPPRGENAGRAGLDPPTPLLRTGATPEELRGPGDFAALCARVTQEVKAAAVPGELTGGVA